jgi:very-short-patch-repair endonuclease
MSEPEVMLWSRLRGRGPERPIFRRQHPVGSLILDLYCPSVRLAVEIDGSTHWDDESLERDAARDRWLGSQGVRVLRIPASAVYRDLTAVTDGVLLRVQELAAEDRPSVGPAPSTPRSSLRSAGGPPRPAARGR